MDKVFRLLQFNDGDMQLQYLLAVPTDPDGNFKCTQMACVKGVGVDLPDTWENA